MLLLESSVHGSGCPSNKTDDASVVEERVNGDENIDAAYEDVEGADT